MQKLNQKLIGGGKFAGDMILKIKNIATNLHTDLGDANNVIEKIIDIATQITAADTGCVFLFNKVDKKLECKHTTKCNIFDENLHLGCQIDVNDGKIAISHVFRKQEGKIIHNIEKEGKLYDFHQRGRSDTNISSQLAAPLIEDKNVPLGVIALNSKYESHFNKEDLELLSVLSELGVSAFRNSENFRENKRMVEKLKLLSEAANVLLKEYEDKTLEEKFEIIVEKTLEILDAELCSLFLANKNKLHLMTSFAIEDKTVIKKREKEEIVLEIKSGYKTGHTGAIAAAKVPYNEFGKKHRSHPAAKIPEKTDWLPSNFNYSELAYPLLDEGGELIGLLLAYNKRDEYGKPYTDRGFSKEFDEPLMKILTSKLIISIKNAKLLNQLKNYELIIENTPDPAVITDKDGIITYMNKGAINLFGDLRGKAVADHYYDETFTGSDIAREIMRKLNESKDGHIQNMETSFKDIRGNPIPLSLSASLLKDAKGEVIATLGIAKDLRGIKTQIEVGNSLLATYEIDELLKKITNECLKLPESNRAYIKLYDEKLDRLIVRALSSQNPSEVLIKEQSPAERGMTAYVFKTQKPYFSGDVSTEPDERYFRAFPDVKSKICIPINSIDRETAELKTLGVISIDGNKLNAFSINDVDFLSTLANQAAVAIENANLIASKTKIITELSALKKVQETITRTLDIDQILESLLDVAVDILVFDYATISRVNFSTGMIETVKGRKVTDEFIAMAKHPLAGNDIQAWVVNNKREVKLDGWDDRLDKKIYDRFNHDQLVRIYLPILSHEEAFGTFQTGYYKTNHNDIAEEEIETLRKVVNLAGIGIDQAYLRSEQQKLVDQLQALNQTGIYIQTLRTEEKAVKQIFDCLRKIGYSKGMLSLVNETTGYIEGRYALGNNWERIKNETRRELDGNDILAIAIRDKKSILSKDCLSDSRCDQPAIHRAKIRSQYVIPLIVNEKAIGTLQIDLSDKQGLVKGADKVLKRRMDVLETFASQIAIVIRNVRDRQMINLLETTLTETAHEFRSPLHNILTQVGGLKSHLPAKYERADEVDEIFKIISEEVNRASRQMENTLLFTDRSRGVVGYNFENSYIQKVIQQCVQNYRLRALERGISIVVKDNVKKLPQFKFDKCKIEQVINNLLDNAIKYSHYNRLIQIQGFDDGTKIHIDVWDKGLGIPRSEFDNIFQGFTRGTHKDKKRYIPGTGLGLKISKEIVIGHGGRITVKSTPFFNDPRKIDDYDGYDTVFSLILPKKPKER